MVLLVPVAKMFKSMGTIKQVFAYGNIVSIEWLPASRAGFPFGFPCGIFHIKRGYQGETRMKPFSNSTQQVLWGNEVESDIEL